MTRLALPPFTTVTNRNDLTEHDTEFMPDGAALVLTPELVEMQQIAPGVLRRRRIIVIDGAPGCGKSIAKAILARGCPVRTATFTMPDRDMISRGTTFMAAAHEAVAGRPVPKLTQGQHENELRHLLTLEPLVLIVDEAQNASTQVLKNLRTMTERPNTKFALALFGHGVLDIIRREQMLWTWRGYVREFRPLVTPHELATAPASQQEQLSRCAALLPFLAALHPRLAKTSTGLLVETNRVYAHGLMRQWMTLLEFLLDIPGDAGFTRQELIDGISLLDTKAPRFAA